MEKWLKLPEWIRWILCWPIILVASFVAQIVGQFMANLAVDRIWLPDDFAEMASPVIASLISLPILMYSIQYLVPRKQHYVVAVLCVLYLLVTINGFVWLYIGIVENADDVWLTVRDAVWAVLALIFGGYFFIKFKNDNSNTV
jgi:hypothetical protein